MTENNKINENEEHQIWRLTYANGVVSVLELTRKDIETCPPTIEWTATLRETGQHAVAGSASGALYGLTSELVTAGAWALEQIKEVTAQTGAPDLAAIRQRLADARDVHALPWHAETDDAETMVFDAVDDHVAAGCFPSAGCFIARAPTDIDALLRLHDANRAEVARLVQRVRELEAENAKLRDPTAYGYGQAISSDGDKT